MGIAFVKGDEKGKRFLRRFLDERGVTWRNVPTDDRWFAPPFEAYDVHHIPFNLLLDREGRVVEVDPAPSRIEAVIERALAAGSSGGAPPR